MKILIAGLAKTGTTGLLYLIANSFAKMPRLLFEPKKCPDDLRSQSGVVVAKILIGTRLNAASFSHFDKKITLVRDPRDRIVSALLYSQYHAKYLLDDDRVRVVREVLEKKEASPQSVPIREVIEVMGRVAGKSNAVASRQGRAIDSLDWFDKYVATIPDALLYKYEDFVSGEYAPLEKHLGMRLSGVPEVPNRLNRVERTKSYGDWRNWFTPEDVRNYQPMLASWLKTHGYDAEDWALNPKPSIAPEHCSGYFMRLVTEFREKQSGGNRARVATDRLTGKVLRARPGVVTGWAIGADPGEPVRVALLINGSEVAQAVADKPRNGLKERGIHPTGHCGFIFRFQRGETLQAGDQVTVIPVDGDFVLQNSPSICERSGRQGSVN